MGKRIFAIESERKRKTKAKRSDKDRGKEAKGSLQGEECQVVAFCTSSELTKCEINAHIHHHIISLLVLAPPPPPPFLHSLCLRTCPVLFSPFLFFTHVFSLHLSLPSLLLLHLSHPQEHSLIDTLSQKKIDLIRPPNRL